MSRLGKKPVAAAKGVTTKVAGENLTISGPKGNITLKIHPTVTVKVEADGQVSVTRKDESRVARAMHGTTRSLIAGAIKGAADGYVKELDIVGVGWSAALKGKEIHLAVGYADVRKVTIPAGVTCEVKDNRIKLASADKQLVGQVAALIRSHRKPEPYNGKGIMYVGEKILRKEGKAFGN